MPDQPRHQCQCGSADLARVVADLSERVYALEAERPAVRPDDDENARLRETADRFVCALKEEQDRVGRLGAHNIRLHDAIRKSADLLRKHQADFDALLLAHDLEPR